MSECMVTDDLLSILSDFVNGRNTEAVYSKELISLAKAHQVEGIVYYKTKTIESRLSYLKCVSDYVSRKRLLDQLLSELESESIPYYVVKGAYVASHYPVPALRTMGDCDILVRIEDKERAATVFKKLGFIDRTHNKDCEWVYSKNGYGFELHHSLFYEKDMYEKKEKDLLSNVLDYTTGRELDLNYHFVYLVSHIKKHLLNYGVGFRQFMDLAIEIKYAGIDGNIVREIAEQAGLLKFTSVCMTLCQRWFGVEVPFEEIITDEFYNYATQKIAKNGVFGFNDSTNVLTSLQSHIRHDGKTCLLVNAIFLPYENILKLEDYSWIENKKWLLPVAWVHRLINKVFSIESRKKGVKTIRDITGTNVRQVNSMLSEWGL